MEYASPGQLSLAKWFLRLGLAFVYGYVAVEIYLSPANFLKYIPPHFLESLPFALTLDQFLLIFGIVEVLLFAWFLYGRYTEYPALISFLLMAAIIVPNMQFFNILFRNVAIAMASLALAALDWRHYKDPKPVATASALATATEQWAARNSNI